MSKGLTNSNLSYELMIFFCRNLSSLLKVGVPLETALYNLSNETTSSFSNVLKNVGSLIGSGLTLSQALEKNGTYFTDVFVSSIRVAEITGNIDAGLANLVNQMEKEKRMEDGIMEMIIYPKILFYISGGFILINLLLLIPLVKSFTPKNLALNSGLLKYLYTLSGTLAGNWKVTLGIIVCIIIMLELFISMRWAKIILMDFFSVLPGFSGVIKNNAITKFLRGLALLINIGMSIIPAIKMAGEMSGNNDINIMSKKMAYILENGYSLTDAFYNMNCFNSNIVSIVENAEKTGNYSEMFDEASKYYEEQAEMQLRKVMIMMKPLITVLLVVFIFANILLLIYPVVNVGIKSIP